MQPEAPDQAHPLLTLFGIAKELFAEPGEWENLIRKEREAFEAAADRREKLFWPRLSIDDPRASD